MKYEYAASYIINYGFFFFLIQKLVKHMFFPFLVYKSWLDRGD